MKRRRSLGGWVWLTCLVLGPTSISAQQAESPSTEAAHALDALLRLRAQPDLDAAALSAAADRVRDSVRAHESDLVQDQLESLTSTDPVRSARAQLLLAQATGLPEALVGDAHVAARVLVALRSLAGSIGSPHQVGQEPPDASVTAALEPLALDLAARLSLSEQFLNRADPDFAADYRRECAPRLASPAGFLRAGECSWLDLEGDRDPELVIVCDSLWPTFWLHEMAFLAVIHPGEPRLQLWRLPSGSRVRSKQVLDLDRDGAPELTIWTDVAGGRAPMGVLMVLSRHGVASMPFEGLSEGATIVTLDDQSVITAPAGLDWAFPGGTAIERCGALARRVDVVHFAAGSLAQVGSVFLPLARENQ